MNTGEIIQNIAREQGINLRQLALKANVPYSTLHGIVSRNSSKVNHETLHRLAVALEVPDYMLLSHAPEEQYKPADETETAALYNRFTTVAVAMSCLTALYAATDLSDLPDETQKNIASHLRTLRHVQDSQLNTDSNDYNTIGIVNAAADGVLAASWANLETALKFFHVDLGKNYKRHLRRLIKIVAQYSELNPDGQKAMAERVDELAMLDKFKSPDMLSRSVNPSSKGSDIDA